MEAYGEFAKVYDMFMDNINYEEWKKLSHRASEREWNYGGACAGTGLRYGKHDGITCGGRL